MITSFRTTDGSYVCAEDGGGSTVIANRPAEGPWEQWDVVTYDDGRVSLRSYNGYFLTAELDRTTVLARATESGEWERFTVEVRDDAIVAFKSYHGTYLQAPAGGGHPIVQVDDGYPRPGEWEFFSSRERFWSPGCPRPLIGPLRIQDKMFRDDSGWRRVLFCSWFPALRILRDNPTEFYRQLDSIAAAGYQGIRVFLAVGGWTPYWDGREVVPVTFRKWKYTGNHLRTDQYGETLQAWPDYDDLLRTLLRACKARQLRLHVTTGDMQAICPDFAQEQALHRRFSRICAEEGGTDVIGVAEMTNEFPLNRYGGDSDMSIAQMGRLIQIWKAAIPGVLTCQGAIPQNEEPASLDRASRFGDLCAVHVTRQPVSQAFKRGFGLVYFEGAYRSYPKAFWEGEHIGPGEDSYQRVDDPASLTGCYAMHAISGQASVRFQGAGVRSFAPLESEWGFTELPALFAALLPENIAQWDHGSDKRGGIEYWWREKDFRTFTHAEWNNAPPRPVASWTVYPSGQSGTGTPPNGITGLLVGTFQ